MSAARRRNLIFSVPPVTTFPAATLKPHRTPMWFFRVQQFRPSTRRVVLRTFPPTITVPPEELVFGAFLTPLLAKLRTPTVKKRQKLFNRNISSLQQGDAEANQREIQKGVQDLQEAAEELQNQQVAARKTTGDGLPGHGELSEAFNGQFLRIESPGSPVEVYTPVSNEAQPPWWTTVAPRQGRIMIIPHGLGRRPQGGIFVRETTANQVVIEGDRTRNIPAADAHQVAVIMNGPKGEEAILLLF